MPTSLPVLFRDLRWPVAAALLVAAAAHVPVTPEHLEEAPYMGAAFALFTVVAAALAAIIVRRPRAVSYRAAMLLGAAAVVVYAATRVVAFPQLGDDVGNWGESLGVVSIVSETLAVVLSAVALRPRTERHWSPCPTLTSPAASTD